MQPFLLFFTLISVVIKMKGDKQLLKQTIFVARAQKGDHEAFIKLIQNYEAVLYNLAIRLLKDEEDVADALQETILIAFQNIHQVKNPRYFNTWICKILINHCQKILRNRQFFLELENIAVVDEKDSTRELFFEDILVNLKDSYSIPLRLHYYNGFSIKEISQILDLPVGTVKSRLSRGRKKIREQEKLIGGFNSYE